MAQSFVVDPPCAVCGEAASHVELVPLSAGGRPDGWEGWSPRQREAFENAIGLYPSPHWWLLYSGIGGENGLGDPVDEAEAKRIIAAFSEPYRYAAVATAGFHDDAGFCRECDAPYCHRHWNVSATGYGTCPRGHGESLDPHWHPDDD